MRVRIDFSLFASPLDAYGSVNGFMEIPTTLKIGDHISLASMSFELRVSTLMILNLLELKGLMPKAFWSVWMI